jgi:hypothetical protein
VSLPGPLAWLLEPANASARFLCLRDLLGRPGVDPERTTAQLAIPKQDPARAILDAQWPEGYWIAPGVGYSPKHKATVWQVIFLAALGAPRTEAIDQACAYVLDHSRLSDGRFTAYASDLSQRRRHARGAVACLNGNLLRAMTELGYADPRLAQSLEALADMVLRDQFCCRFNAPEPLPARMVDGLPCAWGAIKALAAFAQSPPTDRTPHVQRAIAAGLAFLLDGQDAATNLAAMSYPAGTAASPLGLRFGFPLGHTSDLVELLDVLGQLELGADPRLAAAIELVQGKQDHPGRWVLEYTPRNTWAEFGETDQPNKWVTLRVLRALKRCGRWSADISAGNEGRRG